MFKCTIPVIDVDFHDRQIELARLEALVADLVERGSPRWLAIIGQRKVGKTSLVRELERRVRQPGLAFVVMDLFERLPVTLEVFRTYALRAVDALVGAEVGLSVPRLAGRPEYASRVLAAPSVVALPPATRDLVARLPSLVFDAEGIAACLDLPELMAQALQRHLVVAWDEFQELAALSGSSRQPDPLAAMRAAWQRHQRIAYLVSGSAPSLLRELVTGSGSPFFMHFDVMDLGTMAAPEAVGLLRRGSEGRFGEELAHRLVHAVGGHPFYLQVCGEELLRAGPPFDVDALKDTLQRVLFSSSGRLALYFARQYAAAVGRSGFSAAALAALAEAPVEGLRLADVSRVLGVPSGDTARYLERLGDVVERDGQKRYRLADPTFGLWIRWREPSGRAVPMGVLGDEGERRVATGLAGMGFDLVYQSRASRGAFDLLAIRGPDQLGVQVKRRPLPLAFTSAKWNRMEAEAARLGWSWVVAAVDPEHGVVFLDPAAARRGRTTRLSTEAGIPNLLRWLDERQLSARG